MKKGFERCSGVFFNKYLYPGSQADYSMVVFGSRSKGGIGSILHPPKGKDYKWYILPIGRLYATYHPLQEPEKSVELLK